MTTKVTHVSRLAAKDLHVYIDSVVDALGHPGAFVTDESLVQDLLAAGTSENRNDSEVLRLAGEKLRLPVKASDRIITVAHKLKNLARS